VSALKGNASAPSKEQDKKSQAKQLGAIAGVISPRLADCSAHFADQLNRQISALSVPEREAFTQTCREACEKQKAGKTSPEMKVAHEEAEQWRSLHLMGALINQTLFCIHEVGDKSAEAQALVAAAHAARHTPDALAADEADRARREAASPQERSRLEDALTNCMHNWVAERMKKPF
jgi:septal ring factor EnvC (AmiA/AmiB activator)